MKKIFERKRLIDNACDWIRERGLNERQADEFVYDKQAWRNFEKGHAWVCLTGDEP